MKKYEVKYQYEDFYKNTDIKTTFLVLTKEQLPIFPIFLDELIDSLIIDNEFLAVKIISVNEVSINYQGGK